jgi:hypothetical protein
MYTLVLVFTLSGFASGSNGLPVALTSQKIDGFKSVDSCEEGAKSFKNFKQKNNGQVDIENGQVVLKYQCVKVG